MNDNKNGSKKPDNFPQPQPPRRSRAGLVWLLIMILIGVMLMFKTFAPDQ